MNPSGLVLMQAVARALLMIGGALQSYVKEQREQIKQQQQQQQISQH